MAISLQNVNHEWAWSRFEPSNKQPWNIRLAAHLFRRAGFGGNRAQLESALQESPGDVVRSMIRANRSEQVFESSANALAQTVLASGDPRRLSSAWTYRLLYTPNQLLEKATVFWHGHFATSAEKVKDAKMMWDQNQLLRSNALGQFEPLAQAISQDPAMLIYLDSTTNRKSHPNENFARELMELFCLGEGNYTEHDVQELARCFTGWEIKNRKFRKNRYQQDRDVKSLLDESGHFDGEDGVRLVLQQPAMPLFICRKLVRFFVCDEPEFPDELVQPLAMEFRENGLQIAPLIERILSSNLFFSDYAIARKVRSPVELNIGLLRNLEGTTNTVQLAQGLASIGQGLFYPPNVKGWDGGRAWINSSTLLGRANLVQRILNDESTRFRQTTLINYFQQQGLTTPSDQVDWLAEMLLAVTLPRDSRQQLVNQLKAGVGNQQSRLLNTVHTLASTPEFQLG